MDFWLLFRGVDYAYATLCVVLTLYLFTLWDSKRNSKLLYSASFVIVLMFYIKFILAYTIVSLVIAKIIDEKSIIKEIGYKNVIKVLFFLLVGLLPWFFAQYFMDFYFVDRLTGFFLDNGNYPLQRMVELQLGSLSQLVEFFNYYPSLEVKKIPASNAISLLTIPALFYGLFEGKQKTYILGGLIFFVLLVFVPTSSLSWKEAVFLVPFIPILFLPLLETLEDKTRDKTGNNLRILLIIFLIASFLFSLTVVESKNVKDGM